jgi:hypothetical protein
LWCKFGDSDFTVAALPGKPEVLILKNPSEFEAYLVRLLTAQVTVGQLQNLLIN